MARTTRLHRNVQAVLERAVGAAWERLGVEARARDVEAELRHTHPGLVRQYEAECPNEASRFRFYLRRQPEGHSKAGIWLPEDEAGINRRMQRLLGLTPALMRRILVGSVAPANRPDDTPEPRLG